jgi:hypothetical protein
MPSSAAADTRPRRDYRRLAVPTTFRARLAIITAAGAVWRLLYLFVARIDDDLKLNDSLYYSMQAGLNSEGRWFEEALTGQPGAEHGPLTSLYLTPWSLGEGDPVPLQRLAMTLVGIATVAVIGLLGRRAALSADGANRRFAERCGLTAAGIAAVYPNLWVNDSVVMSESLAILLVSAALLLAVGVQQRPSLAVAASLGFVVGLAALARSELILLAGGFAAVLAITAHRRKASWWPTAMLLVACAATVAPWTLYNVGRFDHIVVFTTNDGNTLLGANCDRTYYDTPGGWDIRCLGPETAEGASDPSDRSRMRRQAAIDYLRDHAARVPVVVVARVARALDVYGITDLVRMDVGEDKATWAVWAGIVCWWMLAVAAVIGWIETARRRLTSRWVLLVPIIAVGVTTVAFYGAHRIRAPAEPAIVVLAAIAVAARLERRAGRLAT